MGITSKAMTLLSILAALVIIVYSAEEDFEPDYRDVRPRRYDTVTPHYEQPWRILDMEPVATEPSPENWAFNSQEEPPKRRRPGRKRKRRPPPESEEDLIPQERQVYHEEYRPYQHEKIYTQGITIRRRRKQFDTRQPERPNAWKDDTVDADRPIVRKRGGKRKRPTVEETWPEISEFNEFRPNENTGKYIDNGYAQPTEFNEHKNNHYYDNSGQVNLQPEEPVIKSDFDDRRQIEYADDNHNTKYINHAAADETDMPYDKKDEDKSLSEFSLEIQPPSDDIIEAQQKLTEKAVNTLNDREKAKNNETLDPQILKEILKKSNGRSLSEILQQHNLSLVDLLHGKEKAISILTETSSQNNSEVFKDEPKQTLKVTNETKGITNDKRVNKHFRGYHNRNVEQKPKESLRNTVIIKDNDENKTITSSQNPHIPAHTVETVTLKPFRYRQEENVNQTEKVSEDLPNNLEDLKLTETTTRVSLRRRFPVGSRKKLRMRPLNNTSYKSQLNRDLIALTSRRYQLSRNTSRSREWKDVMPTLVKVPRKDESKRNSEKEIEKQTITTTLIPEETTVEHTIEDIKITTLPDFTDSDPSTTNSQADNTSTESTQTTTTMDLTVTENIPTITITSTLTDSVTTITTTTTTDKPTEKSILRPVVKASDLRRQAFNNRLKRKRLKQKTTTPEPTQEYDMKNIFGMANLVSASEFIAKVQPRTTINDEELDFTTLEDFITTESTHKSPSKVKSTRIQKTQYTTTHSTLPVHEIEETAKIEIEEILNDTLTNARLSKILRERNMTINELVEHRERGSSHIHLADIFHNASREPNPPEPFLSKSLIEPISKETYPLRALLEANLHDPTAKSLDQNSGYLNNINIPIVMDFGNNVNENGENMGIMSLFDNFTKITLSDADVTSQSGESTSITTESSATVSQFNKYENLRESRTLDTNKDLLTWKEIIAIMHRGQKNGTNEVVEVTTKEISPAQVVKKIVLDDLVDEDNSMVMENNLHYQNDIDSQTSISSEEDIPHHLRENTELPQFHGVSNITPNSAKSVTVATASIIGLAMVLFILTYVAFKWKQQRSLFRDKERLRRERIPTPVFENRKGHKINSSTRSKSPMISSSNIYTIETSDMRNGNDSPEYMWDSLRKPFQ